MNVCVREEGRTVYAYVTGQCEAGGSWLFIFKVVIDVGEKIHEWIRGKGCGLGVMK